MPAIFSYPHRQKSGQITCYLNRTYHVLTTVGCVLRLTPDTGESSLLPATSRVSSLPKVSTLGSGSREFRHFPKWEASASSAARWIRNNVAPYRHQATLTSQTRS